VPETAERTASRAFWSGTISFGLVSIPVYLFPANRSGGVSLRMLSPDGTPLARRYYDPETDREIPRERLIRGYEIERDQYVVITDDELAALEPEKTRDIDLRRFVDADAIPPIFFERAYFLTPAGQSTKAYRLLAATMERTNRAGIATFVMRTKEYLVAILAENGILRAETLRFPEEIRDVDEIDLPDRPKLAAKRSRGIEQAIRQLTRKTLDESELEDGYAHRLRELVEAKRNAGTDVVTAPGEFVAEPEDEEDGGDVIDLMEVLKRSLRPPEPGPRRTREPSRRGQRASRDGRRRGGGGGAGDLRSLTRAELYERAQELDIPGRSGMTKEQLLQALRRSA
jgi:DNA end-binding protein Ku